MQDDEQVIFDHGEGYDYDILKYKYDDGNSDVRRGSLDMGTLADLDPLEVHPNAGPATGDDAELDFLEDDLAD
ncbi:hypothetical protein BVRB_3g059790 [Beta vulgaris subsp. vulgaris]|uniref:Uncharacterized protein n=1 Tax=Beta vulgaris subsp. vulgaris TaxID=3555 RepID=A0A0J8CTZ8_BETVV|nr:hypothetical protein BVRB_3g059790 [Beta vulgaris subsp. vulgaris]